LENPDPRIRRYAEKLAVRDIEARAQRFLEYGDDLEPETDPVEFESAAVAASPEDLCSQNEINGPEDDDIPF